ncbi:unnamed protein product [Ixodes pacificus]
MAPFCFARGSEGSGSDSRRECPRCCSRKQSEPDRFVGAIEVRVSIATSSPTSSPDNLSLCNSSTAKTDVAAPLAQSARLKHG